MTETPTQPTWNELLDLVTRLDSSPYADVELDLPGLHLRMSTTAEVTDASRPAPERPADISALARDGAVTPPTTASAETPTTQGDVDVPAANLVEVTAPLLGTFYRRPGPDADPFVEIGSEVATDTSIGVVEVMKMMTPVHAGVAGRVVEICAQDGEMVEHEQVLFRIAPGASA